MQVRKGSPSTKKGNLAKGPSSSTKKGSNKDEKLLGNEKQNQAAGTHNPAIKGAEQSCQYKYCDSKMLYAINNKLDEQHFHNGGPTYGEFTDIGVHSLIQAILDHVVPLRRGFRIADAGAGTFNTMAKLSYVFPEAEFVGLEVDAGRVQLACEGMNKLMGEKIYGKLIFKEPKWAYFKADLEDVKLWDVDLIYAYDEVINQQTMKIMFEAISASPRVKFFFSSRMFVKNKETNELIKNAGLDVILMTDFQIRKKKSAEASRTMGLYKIVRRQPANSVEVDPGTQKLWNDVNSLMEGSQEERKNRLAKLGERKRVPRRKCSKKYKYA